MKIYQSGSIVILVANFISEEVVFHTRLSYVYSFSLSNSVVSIARSLLNNSREI